MADAFEIASARARKRKADAPTAIAARYDVRLGKIVISLSNGLDIAFPPEVAQGLEGASAAALKTIEISPSGFGVHFPKLDADFYLPALLEGVLGSRKWIAARLGAAGVRAKTKAKVVAARQNGRLGGRPKKVAHARKASHA